MAAVVRASTRSNPESIFWLSLFIVICAGLAAAAWYLSRWPFDWHGDGMVLVGRIVMIGLLGYHALFGPILAATIALGHTYDDDALVLRMFPHVVDFLNSFG